MCMYIQGGRMQKVKISVSEYNAACVRTVWLLRVWREGCDDWSAHAHVCVVVALSMVGVGCDRVDFCSILLVLVDCFHACLAFVSFGADVTVPNKEGLIPSVLRYTITFGRENLLPNNGKCQCSIWQRFLAKIFHITMSSSHSNTIISSDHVV